MLVTITLLRAYCKTTDHGQATDCRQPTTDPPRVPPQTQGSPTTNRPSTDPATHWPPISDSPKGLPLTTHPPTNRLTDPATHWIELTLTNQTYFNRVTIRPFFSLINFNFSFGLVLFTTEFVKWFVKNNVDKLQNLIIIPFGNWYFRIGT